MKTKIPILIAAGLLLAGFSKAQYSGGYAETHVSIHGQVVIPGRVEVGYVYNNNAPQRYDNRQDWRNDGRHDRRDIGYRDWREAEYERYCRERRNYRMSREDFYRNHCAYPPAAYYRPAPYYAPRQVAVCR